MATATQANSPILLSSARKQQASVRTDRWLAAAMAALVIVMLAGLARRADHQVPTGDEPVPSILLD